VIEAADLRLRRVVPSLHARFVRKFLQDKRPGGMGWMMARMLSQLPLPLLYGWPYECTGG